MPVTITGSGIRFFDLMREEFEKGIQSNLQMRFDQMPEIFLDEEESNLIFQGNIHTMLADLDANVMTENSLTGGGIRRD